MGDLIVYVTGPLVFDVKLFVDWNENLYRIGLLQKFALEVSTETFLPRIVLTLPALNIYCEDPPEIKDDTIRLVLKHAVMEVEGLEAMAHSGCAVFLGNETIGSLNRIVLEANIGAPKHTLILGSVKPDLASKFPEWVKFDE